jgi:hypothetical protein
MALEPPDTRPPDFGLSSNPGAERLIDSVALIRGGIRRQTDVLIRPVPLGFSIYLQFRSEAAPERIEIEDNTVCAVTDPEFIWRLGAGTFAIEELSSVKHECQPYSRGFIPAQAPLAPSNSIANYRHEARLLTLARRFTRKDDATVIAVLSAAIARDATGRAVPTSLAWPFEGPVLRVHHRHGHYQYPIVARLDFIGVSR